MKPVIAPIVRQGFTVQGGIDMRKGRRKAIVLTTFVFVVVALAGMMSSQATEVCAGPSYQVCVLVNEPLVYSGATATGVMTYTGPTVGAHALIECSYTTNDQLHVQFYVAGSHVSYNPELDRQVC